MPAVGCVLRVDLAHAGWDGLLEQAESARREGAGAVLVVATNGSHAESGEDKALRRLAGLDLPTVAALGGTCDESGLALALSCTQTFAGPDLRIELALDKAGVARLLERALPWRLVEQVGPARARDALFGAQPLTADRLAGCGLAIAGAAPDDAATAAANRLATGTGASLLVRSLRAAQRNSALQSADYDRELLALLANLAD